MREEQEHGGDVFAVAQAHGWSWREIADFSASINPLGPSPLVKASICGSLDRIAHYPEREPRRLRGALARLWPVDENQILLGNGATELIFFLSRTCSSFPITLADPVFSEFRRAFPQYRTCTLIDRESWPREGLLVLTRPANPTGWSVSLGTIEDYLSTCEANVLIDESFLEFSGLPSAAELIASHPRLMILRSLTKFYALPGLRVGALVATASQVSSWRKQREPWQVNVLAEEAALAAVSDTNHAARSIEFVQAERKWMSAHLQFLPGVDPAPSDGNYILAHLNYPAAPLCQHFLNNQILIRNCTGWPGVCGEAVRVAVRTREENERLLHAWKDFPA